MSFKIPACVKRSGFFLFYSKRGWSFDQAICAVSTILKCCTELRTIYCKHDDVSFTCKPHTGKWISDPKKKKFVIWQHPLFPGGKDGMWEQPQTPDKNQWIAARRSLTQHNVVATICMISMSPPPYGGLLAFLRQNKVEKINIERGLCEPC